MIPSKSTLHFELRITKTFITLRNHRPPAAALLLDLVCKIHNYLPLE